MFQMHFVFWAMIKNKNAKWFLKGSHEGLDCLPVRQQDENQPTETSQIFVSKPVQRVGRVHREG